MTDAKKKQIELILATAAASGLTREDFREYLGVTQKIPKKKLITVRKAAKLLQCHERTVYRMVENKQLKRYPIGQGNRNFRVDKREVLSYSPSSGKS